MKPTTRTGLFFLGFIVAIALAAVFVFVRFPIALQEEVARWGLSRGLDALFYKAPRGDMAYWKGGDGETVILIHGVGNQAGTWVGIAPALAERFRTIVVDLPGHGDSEPEEGSLELADLVEAIGGLIEAEAPGEPVTLVGNSLGGWVALTYALDHPDRVKRVIGVASAGLAFDFDTSILTPEDRQGAERMLRAVTGSAFPDPPGFVLDAVVRRSKDSPARRLLASYDESWLLDEDRLARFDVPVDLIWGADDGMIPLALGEQLERALPNARLQVIPNCGHVPQQTCLVPFYTMLTEILVRGEASGSP